MNHKTNVICNFYVDAFFSGKDVPGCADILAHSITFLKDCEQCAVSSVQKELLHYKV